VVPKRGFWHNCGMPKRAEKNAEIQPPVPTAPPVEPAHATRRGDRAFSDDRAASAEIPGGERIPIRGDRAVSQGIPSGEAVPRGQGIPIREIGGPSGPEPTRYGDWEKKGRCIDF